MTSYENQMAAVKMASELYETLKQQGYITPIEITQWLNDAYSTIAAVKMVESLEPKEKES